MYYQSLKFHSYCTIRAKSSNSYCTISAKSVIATVLSELKVYFLLYYQS